MIFSYYLIPVEGFYGDGEKLWLFLLLRLLPNYLFFLDLLDKALMNIT